MDMLDHETIASFGGLLPPLKQQWHYLQHNKKSTSQDDMHFVPDHDLLDPSSWAELQPPSGLNMEGKFMMDGKFSMDSKFSKQMWQQPDITCWMPSQPTDGVTPSIPEGRENDSTNLDSLVGGVLDQHQSQQQNLSTSFHDEDIQSWLQYPLDDPVPDSNYCLESWGELPPSSPVNREPPGNGNVTVSWQGFSGKPNGGNNSGSVLGSNSMQNGLRGSNAEEAMDLAAKRASGMIPVSGVETFNKVRSTSMPTITTSNVKWIPLVNGKASGPSSCPPSGLEPWHRGKVSHIDNGNTDSLKETASVQPSGLASEVMMAPPPATSNRSAPINFAHFSRPAAIFRNLQSMEAGVCGGLNSSLKAVGNKTRSLSTTSSSVAESTIMTASAVHGVRLVDSPTSITYFPGSGRTQDQDMGRGGDIGNQVGSMVETDSPGVRKMMKSASAGVPMRNNSLQKNASLPVKLGDDQLDMGNASTISRILGNGNADQGMILRSKQSLEATSCYDGESYERDDKDAIAWNKRKRSREEDTEYGTSDDAVEESVDTKKQGRGGNTTGTTSSAKRTRAAEVHNLSERKRRDRINERMKALQDLIPNSNKTDKASMLDEAIEYLKMLQVQLQMMAMRAGMPQMAHGQQFGQLPMGGLNGMAMPQMSQMSQMSSMSQMGMGGVGAMQMGMGMGMGMGMSTGMAPLGNFGMGVGMGGPAMGVGMGVGDLPNMPHSLPHTMGQGMPKGLPQGLPFSPPQRQRQEGSCVQSTSSSGQMPSQSGGMSENVFPRQLAPSTVDPLGAYLSRQQQRQSHQPVNLELYQTFMLQQHQQH